MVIRFFIDYRISWLIGLPIIIITYSLLNNYTNHHVWISFLDLNLFSFKINHSIISSKILAPLFVFFNATLISQTFNFHNFIEKNTYTSPLLYVVLMSFFNDFYCLSNVTLTHTFLILSLSKFLHLKSSNDNKKLIFDCALFFSIASCLFPVLTVFLPFVFFMIWVSRPFLIRDALICLAGIITPFIYVFCIRFFNKTPSLNIDPFPNLHQYNFNYEHLVLFALSTLLTIFAFISIKSRIKKPTIKLRNQFKILTYWFFICFCIGITSLIIQSNISAVSFIITPLVFILTYGFLSKTKKIQFNLLFFLLFLFSFIKFLI